MTEQIKSPFDLKGAFDYILFLCVALEYFVYALLFLILVLCNKAYNGNNDQGYSHCGNSHFGGFGRCGREAGVDGYNECGYSNREQTCNHARISADLCDALGEKSPDVRTDKAA